MSLATKGMDAEVIVVDNCSSDGSIDYLKDKFPEVEFIANTVNTGFAKANNLALARAKGDFVLYLNPDTLLPDSALQRCLDFFDRHAEVGALGVKMVDGSGLFLPESKRAFPSAMVSFYKLCGLSKLFPRSKRFGRYALGYLNENQNHEVEVLAGAFMMGRASLLKAQNGFDERYFMYGEDIDLSYCLQQSGYKNYYLGEVSIIHFKGESAQKGSGTHLRNFYNAMLLFVDKHYKGWLGVVYRGLLKTAIAGRYLVSAGLAVFSNRKKKNGDALMLDLKSFTRIELLGDSASAASASTIWEQYVPGAPLHFTPANDGVLTTAIEKKETVAWVFCIGPAFSYEAAIELLETRAPMPHVYWHYLNLDNLISSSDKKGLGDVLVGEGTA